MDEVAASGQPHGGYLRPFGFENDKVTVRADEAALIRVVVARFLAGESLRSLATWLDDEGTKTVSGKPWNTTTLRGVITSGRVAGLREHRGVVVGPAAWPAIVSAEDRERVLALMESKRVSGRRTPRRYLLSGLLRCGRCGGTLFSSRREQSRRYVCSSGPDHRGCGRLTVVAEPLEELVAAAVLYRLDSPALTAALTGEALASEQASALSEAVAGDRGQLEELAGLYASKSITAAEWMAARAPIEARVKDNERRLARLSHNDALVGVMGNGAALGREWGQLNLDRQHAIVRAVVDHITIAPLEVSRARRFDPDRVDLRWRV